MAPPVRTVTNILVGIGTLFLAPENTAPPADTLPAGDAWLTPWVHPGFTEDGVDFDSTRKEVLHRVDEMSSPAFLTINETETKIVTSLAESTLENFKYAFGGGVLTTQAAASAVIGKKTLVLSETVDLLALGLEGVNPQGFFRRIYIPRIASVGKIKQEYNRSKKKQLLQVEFQAICPINQITITDKTANALP
jgi:hypothetical protein